MGTPIDKMLKRVSAAGKAIEKARSLLRKDAKALMKEAFTSLFEENPQIIAFRWKQGTPSWNDGDACYFGREEARVLLRGAPLEAGGFGDGFMDTYDLGRTGTTEEGGELHGVELVDQTHDALINFEEILEELGDDNLEDIFGDPSEITVTKRGIKVETISADLV